MSVGGGQVFPSTEANQDEQKSKLSVSTLRRDVTTWFKSFVEDKSLVVFQIFYFFYFAAFGSLFPLISIYFKQLGLSALQCGALSGIRALLECIVTPFWGTLAEKWKKGKIMVLFSLVCSLAFTLGIGFVRPAPEGCLVQFPQHRHKPANASTDEAMLSIVPPYRLMKYVEVRSIDMTRDLAMNVRNKIGQSPVYLNTKRLIPPPETGGGDYSTRAAYHDTTHYPPGSLVMPLYSTIVYSQTKINQMFIILILLVVSGELLSCPALPLVDGLMVRTVQVEQTNFYGRQRMLGSVGWGLAMFIVGLALDNASSFPDYPCLKPGARERNYMVCFATYSVFLACSLFAATQFRFIYEGDSESMYFKMVKDKVAKALLGRTTKSRGKLVNEDDSADHDAWKREVEANRAAAQFNGPSDEEILEKQLGIKLEGHTTKRQVPTAISVESPQENYMSTANLKITQWSKAMKEFGKPSLLAFLFVTWFMGLGVGQVFTFLFWHLQELNGSPTLFGIATVFNHVSEIFMCYFSKFLLDKIGHLKVLYIGLTINVARFLYVSWLSNPWWILPFEFVQGLTHAGVWIACCSYITQAFAPELRSVTQGFLQGIHYGLGRGLGAILGGVFISSYGSASMFCAYGAASAVVLLCFLALNYFLPIPNTLSTDAAADVGKSAALGGGPLDEKAEGGYGSMPSEIQAGRTAGIQFGLDPFQPSTATHDYYMQQQ